MKVFLDCVYVMLASRITCCGGGGRLMVLGKPSSAPECPINFDNSTTRATVLAVGAD